MCSGASVGTLLSDPNENGQFSSGEQKYLPYFQVQLANLKWPEPSSLKRTDWVYFLTGSLWVTEFADLVLPEKLTDVPYFSRAAARRLTAAASQGAPSTEKKFFLDWVSFKGRETWAKPLLISFILSSFRVNLKRPLRPFRPRSFVVFLACLQSKFPQKNLKIVFL